MQIGIMQANGKGGNKQSSHTKCSKKPRARANNGKEQKSKHQRQSVDVDGEVKRRRRRRVEVEKVHMLNYAKAKRMARVTAMVLAAGCSMGMAWAWMTDLQVDCSGRLCRSKPSLPHQMNQMKKRQPFERITNVHAHALSIRKTCQRSH